VGALAASCLEGGVAARVLRPAGTLDGDCGSGGGGRARGSLGLGRQRSRGSRWRGAVCLRRQLHDARAAAQASRWKQGGLYYIQAVCGVPDRQRSDCDQDAALAELITLQRSQWPRSHTDDYCGCMEQVHIDGFALAEYTGQTRLEARGNAQKRAKNQALQDAFAQLVIVVDHGEHAMLCLFNDEL
jgi:hypothetical protein